MLKLLYVEILKIRRSLAVLMLFAIPALVVVLNTLMLAKRPGFDKVTVRTLEFYWMGNTSLWCYFMLPLYIALVSGLLNGHEHKNHTWRLMMTLPVNQSRLFVTKAILVWLFAIASTTALAGASAAIVALLGGSPPPVWSAIARISLACIPIVIIQHAVSWRFQNIVAPLAFGVLATMGITQIGSSSDWIWYPWTYPMMAVNGSDPAMRDQAIQIALATAAPLLAMTTLYLGRREIPA
jgi:hypothetical protein